jgi:hypothetical protein
VFFVDFCGEFHEVSDLNIIRKTRRKSETGVIKGYIWRDGLHP